mmetsp:Transcript_3695/g.10504  ORF Transcript_3695/g.10504 Transcript_3695/m.10504 type:complete len:260 (-) Transcript_3695:224-1003(-)
MIPRSIVLFFALVAAINAFAIAPTKSISHGHRSLPALAASAEDGSAWNGEVVSNPTGRIQGCQLARVGESLTDWEVAIDGIEADLAKFSEVVYKKITSDAKQQRFQGFRPGTIPPHLTPTYVAFAMDEVAREATLEALEQNGVRPFENTRSELTFDNISIPPPQKKKKKKGKKKKSALLAAPQVEEETPAWLTFDSMKAAIDAGWRPGKSFSFVAKGVKGQQLKDQDVSRASPVGEPGFRPGTSVDWNAIDVASEATRE